MHIYSNLLYTIGNTPLVKIKTLFRKDVNVLAKLEYFNPLSSVKDRIAYSMIEAAEREGKISADTTIIEPTSGNTGIGLAFVCAIKGYKLILTMPESMSIERRRLLKALGAELILTPADKGMKGAIEAAEQYLRSNKNVFMPQQFKNPANPEIHRRTTAEEIWRDTEGNVDIFIAGVGTGGTITGVGEVLKARRPSVKIIAVEPAKSAVITQKLNNKPLQPAPHGIQGIGAGFIPDILNLSIIDEIVQVEDEAAYEFARLAAKKEGILCGISSGAALYAAKVISDRRESTGKNIVVIVPSCGERYLSTPLFS